MNGPVLHVTVYFGIIGLTILCGRPLVGSCTTGWYYTRTSETSFFFNFEVFVKT